MNFKRDLDEAIATGIFVVVWSLAFWVLAAFVFLLGVGFYYYIRWIVT